jgi:hypothetical protein
VAAGSLARVTLRSLNQARRCARTSCRWPASATLTFGYVERTVWVEDLRPQKDRNAYDLCAAHAERTTVPIGWRKDDRRVAPPAPAQLRLERRFVIPDRDETDIGDAADGLGA